MNFKKILICGLPNSGKTTFAKTLVQLTKGVHLNADEIRKEYNDWDFSMEGRERQALRMKDKANSIVKTGKVCIADFIAPTPKIRKLFNADCVIWMDTIQESIYQDTNELFVPLTKKEYNWRIKDFGEG